MARDDDVLEGSERMGSYILCQQKRTAHGYYLESISSNIFSMEELCFFIYHNIYLLDEKIINDKLCQWIREDLGLKALGIKLSNRLREGVEVEDFILPIFKEINYLSHEEYKRLGAKLEQFEEQPSIIKEKLKGDCLVRYGKYINGIKVYQKILSEVGTTKLGGQFDGTVYHNMGCAYARLFQLEEALTCFKKACELLHTKAAIKSYLGIIYIMKTRDDFEEEALRLGVDEQTKVEVIEVVQAGKDGEISTTDYKTFQQAKEQRAQGNTDEYQKTMNLLLEKMTKEYHNSTGL